MTPLLVNSVALDRWRDRGASVLRFAAVVWEQIVEDNLLIRASGLAYSTLLAIVPLVAVGFALFTGFEAFAELEQRLRTMLFEQLLPSGQEQISSYLDNFVENSRDLGIVGVVVLLVTAVLLLDNIDWNFNEVGTSSEGAIWSAGSPPTPRCWSSGPCSSV